jgi:hypothetical protein
LPLASFGGEGGIRTLVGASLHPNGFSKPAH